MALNRLSHESANGFPSILKGLFHKIDWAYAHMMDRITVSLGKGSNFYFRFHRLIRYQREPDPSCETVPLNIFIYIHESTICDMNERICTLEYIISNKEIN